VFEIFYIIIFCRDRLKKYEGDSCLPYPGEKPVEYNNMAPGGEADFDTRVGRSTTASEAAREIQIIGTWKNCSTATPEGRDS
jgi:hypothetical protein